MDRELLNTLLRGKFFNEIGETFMVLGVVRIDDSDWLAYQGEEGILSFDADIAGRDYFPSRSALDAQKEIERATE